MRLRALLCLILAVVLASFAAAAELPVKHHYWFAARAPRPRPGVPFVEPSLGVFDIDHGHRLVRNIPLPDHVRNIKGIAASAVTRRAYIGHWGDADDLSDILCLDFVTGEILWEKKFPPGPGADRFTISPDGQRLYMPAGETGYNSYWVVADAISGDVITTIDFTSAPHNTLMSLDGKHVYLQSHQSHICPDHEATPYERSIAIADTATNKVIKTVGPFRDQIRPFTINGDETLLFAIVNNLVGFQVADIRTGRVLYTATPPDAWPQPGKDEINVWSHGIALSADEKQVWICDQKSVAVHAFDVSGLPARAPKYLGTVKTGAIIPRAPGWLNMSLDSRFVYPETGEIIDAATRKQIGMLRDESGTPFLSRWTFEADFTADMTPVLVGDQFSVGRVRRHRTAAAAAGSRGAP